MRKVFVKSDWTVVCLILWLLANVVIIVYLARVDSEELQQAKAEVVVLKEAIGKIYDKSISVRISLDIRMWEVAQEKWYEDLQPAMEDALELCVEYKGMKRTQDMESEYEVTKKKEVD